VALTLDRLSQENFAQSDRIAVCVERRWGIDDILMGGQGAKAALNTNRNRVEKQAGEWRTSYIDVSIAGLVSIDYKG
jgi:hypothetical protein